MDRDETWTVDGANIVKTEVEHGRVETTVYSDIDGDGVVNTLDLARFKALFGRPPGPGAVVAP